MRSCRYLTFCSFTLQTLQLSICCLAHVVPVRARRKPQQAALQLPVDPFVCILPLPNTPFLSGPTLPCPSLPQSRQHRQRLSALADRLACALFGVANTVTAMYFVIEGSTNVGGGWG